MSSESDYSFLSDQEYSEVSYSSDYELTDTDLFEYDDIIEIRERIKTETTIRNLDRCIIYILSDILISNHDYLACYIVSKYFDIQKALNYYPICHVAAIHECTETLKYLIQERHVSPNIQDAGGQTPLHSAVMKGKVKSTELLIELDADINVRDNDGNTPLHVAVYYEKVETERILLSNSVRLEIRNNKQRTPLYLAFEHFNPFIINNLIAFGAMMNVRDYHGNTPLHAMMTCDNCYKYYDYVLDYINIALSRRIDINTKNNNKNTPLYEYIKCISRTSDFDKYESFILSVIKFFITHGASPNTKNENGNTVLHLIPRVEYINIIKLLIRV